MNLFTTLKIDLLQARKQFKSDDIKILTTLVGEIETKSKRDGVLNDEMVLATIRKTISNNEQTIGLNVENSDELQYENSLLEKYLPTQLSEDELREILSGVFFSNIGEAMSYLKNNHSGKYDGKLASSIIREMLS